jgi:hypothetical protein
MKINIDIVNDVIYKQDFFIMKSIVLWATKKW